MLTAATGPGANAADGTSPAHPAHLSHAYQEAVATGISHIFLSAAVVCAAGFLAALFIKEVPLRGEPAGPKPAAGRAVSPADA
ncbi:hypothetical protein OG729_36695 [Streptomyces sp. NBC_00210]|uniref:hypothetical protein n=1 Tax=unclassified Streptomyces TaxID=2593676 RepID=UPI003251FB19